MWIDGVFDLQVDRRGIASVGVSWVFDDFNSSELIFSFDEDLDGELDRAEQREIEQRAFAHLGQADYFVVAFAGTRRVQVPAASDFRATIDEGRMRYEFTLPLRLGWDELDDFVMGLFDSSYYIDFLSDPAHERYSHGNRSLALSHETLHLESEGWGTIRVPVIRVALR